MSDDVTWAGKIYAGRGRHVFQGAVQELTWRNVTKQLSHDSDPNRELHSYTSVIAWINLSFPICHSHVEVQLSLCLTNYALRHEGVWGRGCIDPRFLDIGTSWRWVVNFTPRPLYPRGRSPQHPLDMRLGEPQNRCGRRGEKKILDPIKILTSNPLPSSP
jgi:hypothetical protein